MNLNLEQPIFVYYFDVSGYTFQKATELLEESKKLFKYDNITTWIVPINSTSKIECIYKPNDKLKKLIDKINTIINYYKIDSTELKSLIRDFKIENILEEE